MKTAIIRHRVADFLRRHEPFHSMPEQAVLDLAGSGRIRFHEAGEYVYRAGDRIGDQIWVVQQGRVELLDGNTEDAQLRDVLGGGELLGVDRCSGATTFAAAARTASDVLLYSLNGSLFEQAVQSCPAAQQYIEAHFSVNLHGAMANASWFDFELPPFSFWKDRYQSNGADPGMDVGAAAVAYETLTGIEAELMLIRERSAAMLVASGTEKALIRAEDLELFGTRSFRRLVLELESTFKSDDMRLWLGQVRRLLQEGLTAPRQCDPAIALNAEASLAAAKACIRSAGDNGGQHCWIAIGRTARLDAVLPEPPLIALLYFDEAEAPRYGALIEQVEALLAETGPGVSWPEEAKRCLSLTESRSFYEETIAAPLLHNMFARREFFDVHFVSGDQALYARVLDHFTQALHQNPTLIPLLANDTLSSLPPLAFYEDVVLGLDGEQVSTLDLEASALTPIISAARVFAVAATQLAVSSTLERLQHAAKQYPEERATFAAAADAYRICTYLCARYGMSQIETSRLTHWDRRQLKSAFTAISSLLVLTSKVFLTERFESAAT